MRTVIKILLAIVLLAPAPVLAQEAPGLVKGAKRPKNSPGASSYELVSQAWKAFEAKDYSRAVGLAGQCVQDYTAIAAEQGASLRELPLPEVANDYWALNDVATALYIRGRSFEKQNQQGLARMVYAEILKKYPYAQCYDPKDYYWAVAVAARDRIKCMDLHIDFGDYKSSTLTAKAWDSLKQGRALAAEVYAQKCIDLYSVEAKTMQASLKDFPSEGLEWNYWALNDVGTCMFIKGQALVKQGKQAEGEQAFKEILGTYYYAQCWDNTGGWFWKVADAARKLLFKNKEV